MWGMQRLPTASVLSVTRRSADRFGDASMLVVANDHGAEAGSAQLSWVERPLNDVASAVCGSRFGRGSFGEQKAGRVGDHGVGTIASAAARRPRVARAVGVQAFSPRPR